MHSFSLIGSLSGGVVVAAALLGGCEASPPPESSSVAVKTDVNPYPAGAPTPFFYPASEWNQYTRSTTKRKPAD